ncbi:patatin-like phospholipase family protein [Demequina sp.]|uniref:patatin-like phospholipase family protein n=1 Tax=Demequina sp. TaxID=2050685 RepID=UPI0025B8981B|nr:patatin-like phospholipase family protein [Demequina sp.]
MSKDRGDKPRRVALALGSGGARGYAHIGVIEEIEARGWEIVGIAGSSMGAVIGGLYVAGGMESYRDWVVGLGRRDVIRLMDVSVGGAGLLRASKVMSKVNDHLGDLNIEDARIPYTAIAVDLVSEREIWFTSGPMIDAIRGSIAIPSVFTPLVKNGMVLADGGLLNPVPVTPLANVHSDAIIAVNLSGTAGNRPGPPPEPGSGGRLPRFKLSSLPDVLEPTVRALLQSRDKPEGAAKSAPEARTIDLSALDVVDRSLHLMQDAVMRYRLAAYPPDVQIDIPVDACGTLDFHRAKELIALGRKRAIAVFDAWDEASAPPS